VEICRSGTIESVFQDAKLMEELAKSHQVVIFSDCVKLYNITTTKQERGHGYICQDFIFYPFWDTYNQYNNSCNRLDNLYEKMVMFVNTKTFRENAKKVKRKILDYSEYLVQENGLKNKFSTIYDIASDEKSMEWESPYKNEILRYESNEFWWQQVNIGCARFSTHQENPEFPCYNQYGQYIAFSMWQFIEIIGLEKLKERIDFIGETDIRVENIFSEFRNRYLYLDYSECQKQV